MDKGGGIFLEIKIHLTQTLLEVLITKQQKKQ